MIECLVKLLNVCFVTSMIPVDWTSACLIPLYKGEGDIYGCTIFRGRRLLSVMDNMYS